MAETTSVNLRIDKDLKKQAEQLFEKLGINMTTAMNMFLRQAVREQGLPFKLTAATEYDVIPAYRSDSRNNASYDDFIADSLRQCDLKVAEGKMKYYTADEVISRLEEVLNMNTKKAIKEYDAMKNNPEMYKRYDTIEQAISEVLNEETKSCTSKNEDTSER